jgi:periplasmic divalent cation tolerance protein
MDPGHRLQVVLTTVPDVATGKALARRLVEEKLAACVNVLPGLTSVYRWEGKIEEGSEALMIAKLGAGGFVAYRDRLKQLHPYQVPEIVALDVAAVNEAYAGWVLAQLH